MKVRQIASIVALALLVPSAAHAQSAAPPGSAAVDQYREQAPPAGSGGRKLTDDRRRELESRGPEGRALADALDRNGGVPSGSAGGGANGAGSDAPAGGTGGDGDGDGDDRPGRSGSGGSDRDTASKTPRGASSAEDGGESPASAGATAEPRTSLAESSATSTVGGLPVWSLLVGAMAVVGVGAVVRGRRAS